MSAFYEKLKTRWHSTGSLLCVGLDPSPEYLAEGNLAKNKPYFDFCSRIVEAAAEFVCAFKFQMACFAQCGREDELKMVIKHVHVHYPDIPIILDAKRADIGITASRYADEAFIRYGADAVTVNPYLGSDSIQAFTERAEHGIIVLCRTSNSGSSELQELKSGNMTVYEHVAQLAATKWNRNNNVALVVGATYPEALKKIRRIVGKMPLLVPGIGAQGGDLEAVLKFGLTDSGDGLIINVSRGIIKAGMTSKKRSQQAVHHAARQYFARINALKTEVL